VLLINELGKVGIKKSIIYYGLGDHLKDPEARRKGLRAAEKNRERGMAASLAAGKKCRATCGLCTLQEFSDMTQEEISEVETLKRRFRDRRNKDTAKAVAEIVRHENARMQGTNIKELLPSKHEEQIQVAPSIIGPIALMQCLANMDTESVYDYKESTAFLARLISPQVADSSTSFSDFLTDRRPGTFQHHP
jgi:hypothetical protein